MTYVIWHLGTLTNLKMKKPKSFTINLSNAEGSGEVACPKCGIKISPDDQTEETYTILKPVMKGENLERISTAVQKMHEQNSTHMVRLQTELERDF